MTGHRASQKPDQAAVSTERSTGLVATERRTGLVAYLPDHRAWNEKGVGLARSLAEKPCVKSKHQVSQKLRATARKHFHGSTSITKEVRATARKCFHGSTSLAKEIRATARKCFHCTTSPLKEFGQRLANSLTIS